MKLLLLLLALLLSARDACEAHRKRHEDVARLRALQDWAVGAELMDPRERKHLLARPEQLPDDLPLLWKRWADLLDAPPICDVLRLPGREAADAACDFNRAYRANLDLRRGLQAWREAEIDEACSEADRLYAAWDDLRDATRDFYYVTVRRQALKRLRDRVGAFDFYHGVMPPAAPYWRFTEID